MKGELASQVNSSEQAKKKFEHILVENQSAQDKLLDAQKKLINLKTILRDKDNTIAVLETIIEKKKSDLDDLMKELLS